MWGYFSSCLENLNIWIKLVTSDYWILSPCVVVGIFQLLAWKLKHLNKIGDEWLLDFTALRCTCEWLFEVGEYVHFLTLDFTQYKSTQVELKT